MGHCTACYETKLHANLELSPRNSLFHSLHEYQNYKLSSDGKSASSDTLAV
jgi:hypothetical protein